MINQNKRLKLGDSSDINYLETIGYICTGLVSYISNGSRTPAHISRIVISDSFRDTSMKVFDSVKNQLSFDVHYMIANGLAKSVKKYHKSTKCPFYGGDRNFIEKSVLGPEFRFAIHNHEPRFLGQAFTQKSDYNVLETGILTNVKQCEQFYDSPRVCFTRSNKFKDLIVWAGSGDRIDRLEFLEKAKKWIDDAPDNLGFMYNSYFTDLCQFKSI